MASNNHNVHYYLSILNRLPGFWLLTEEQRRLIKLSFIIQNRANRDLPTRWEKLLEFFGISKKLRYPLCLRHIHAWYCHGAIATLESGYLAEKPADNPPNFFAANYTQVGSTAKAESLVRAFGYPSVVHISISDDYRLGEDPQLHSFLVLGELGDEIVTWDKEGFFLPYRLNTVSETFRVYNNPNWFWGIRNPR